MQRYLFIGLCLLGLNSVAQVIAPVELQQEIQEMHVDKNFDFKYQQAYRQIKRVYPLALQAKSYLIEFDKDLAEIEKRRKQKKYGKEAHKILKDQFVYDIRDLYISEGIMLMKLVHRETGTTVSDIIKKYRGQVHANLYEEMGKVWEQNLNIQYDPFGEDWIIEVVIQDIIAKKIPFNWDIKPLNRETFKVKQKEYKTKVKEYKKIRRETKKAASKSKKQED